ncbi:MAG TPA: metallophosphoesterase family protein [Longimicrobiales bacterium]|nr:metallophosphoesterase family protein [Longimicrobiales bacterium]
MESGTLRVGVVSDTHGLLRAQVLERLEGVHHILHAGDVGGPHILDELEALAPVSAVWGNTDGFEVRARVREEARLELAGRRLVVLHGHQLGSPAPAGLRARYPDADLVVYGHTHQPLVDREGTPVTLNPGSVGRARFDLPVSLAVVTLTRHAEMEIELIRLDVAAR